MEPIINKKDKIKIKNLYLKERLSMKQIADKLNVSPSTIAYHMKKMGIGRRSISESIIDINITKFNKEPFKIKSYLTKKEEILKASGVMLYWGEGNKKGNTVRFVNSDPEMIYVFLKFLRNICGVSEGRIKALLHMYDNQNEKELVSFWSNSLNIPIKNFHKTYIHKGKIGTYKNKSKYGTLAITYSDKRLLNLILSWIEKYSKNIQKPE